MSRIGRAFTWGLSIVLALFFVVVGASKVTSPGWAERFVDWGYPGWFRTAPAARWRFVRLRAKRFGETEP